MKKISASILSAIMMLSMIFSSSVFAANDQTQTSAWDSFLGLFSKATTTETMGVQYAGWVQDVGQTPTDGTFITGPNQLGTPGLSRRLEGVQIKLTGDIPSGASIKYNVHVQNIGWLYDVNDTSTWASDGAYAGTKDRSLRIEDIMIVLVGADGKALPGYSVSYQGHVENEGDTAWVADGKTFNNTGKSQRLECLKVKIIQLKADMTAYNTAVAAVSQADYTKASWTTYQAVVDANKVTEDNSQQQVDAATAAITAAQKNLVTKAIVTSATATTQNTITLQGTVLNKLAVADVTVDNGVIVSSITPNADGTSATVKLASDLVADKNYKVTVVSDGTSSVFTVKYTIVAQKLAVNSGMYDRNLTNQKLTLTLDGTPVTADYLAANGYTVTFYAYNSDDTVNTSLFGASSNNTGLIAVPQSADGTYLVQATAVKGSTILTSEKATIKIADIVNTGTAINSYKMTQGSDATLKTMNSTNLVVNETTTISKVVVQYSSSNTVSMDSGFVLSSSNSNVVSVVNNYSVKAVAPGTATVTIQVGTLTKEITFTVTQAVRVPTTITASASPANAFITSGGVITDSTNTITVVDQFGDPCVGLVADTKFTTGTPTDYTYIKYAATGSIGGFAFDSTPIAAASTDADQGKYTVKYDAATPADGQIQTIAFTNKAATSLGSFTVKAVANNAATGYKVDYKGGSDNQSNTINNNMAGMSTISLVVNEYNSNGLKLGQKADISGFTLLYDPNMVTITGKNASGGTVDATSDSEGKFVCGTATNYIVLSSTSTVAGTTPVKVYTDSTLVKQIDTRTITVSTSTPKITAVAFKSVTPQVGTINFKNVLTYTSRSDLDSIISSSVTLSEVTGYDVCIHDVTTTSSSPAASEAPDNKTIYLDKNRDGTYQTGEKIGELVFTVNNTQNTQGIGVSSNQVIISTGAKGSFTYTVWDTTPTTTAPVVVAYNTVQVDLVGTVPTTTAVTASVAAGTYNATQSVTLSAAAGATIYYTTDNSTPTTASNVYSSPLSVATSQTIKAIAVQAGYTNSAVASFAYVIDTTAPTITSVTSGLIDTSDKKLVMTVVGAAAVNDSVDVTKITIKDSSETLNYTLTDSTGVVTDGTHLTVTLSATDLAAIAGAAGSDVTMDVANGVLFDAAGNVSADFGSAQTAKPVTVQP